MFIEELGRDPKFFFAMLISIVLSICLHELAHGITAIWLGDDTPIETGHMTLNPLVHMGPMSLLMLVIAGIAWGAMPVNPSRLRGRYGDALVSLAGPVSNLLLSLMALVALGLWQKYDLRDPDDISDFAMNGRYLLAVFGQANMLLAIFNMVPVPPLDGSRVLASVIPASQSSLSRFLRSPVLFLLLFLFASQFISSIASDATIRVLRLVRGW